MQKKSKLFNKTKNLTQDDVNKEPIDKVLKGDFNKKTDLNNLDTSLGKNIAFIKELFIDDETLFIRELENKYLSEAKFCIIYLEGMVNEDIINNNVIQPILSNNLSKEIDPSLLFDELVKKVIVTGKITIEIERNKVIESIIKGNTLLLVEGYSKALIIKSKGYKVRDISEPEASKVVRGPREGFTESLIDNLTLIRRRILSEDLKFKFREIGERTHTKLCMCYLESIAKDSVLKELENRLDQIKIDGVIDSGYIQELIKDAPYSPFETVGSYERPDVITSKLLEGRIALFVEGSPFVLTVPFVVAENFQANEDYYNNYIFGSINRFLRGFTAVTTITIPAVFLAIVTYHHEMLPTPLLLSIIASRQDVPIPTSVSLFLMLFIFDILREASTRMPAHIGQAVSIIGTIVLGQAAVEARLVSAPVIIITALTGITTLLNMNFVSAVIIFRTILLLGASLFGIYGFLITFILLYLHLMSIRSFDVPYMMNVTKALNHDGQDAWIRAPWWKMTLRPKIIGAKNLRRQIPYKKKKD